MFRYENISVMIPFLFYFEKAGVFVAPSPCFVNKEVSPDWFISEGGNGARAQGHHV
jgi:hypothetical protein